MILSTEEIEKRVSDSYELPNRVLGVMPEPLVTVRTSTCQHAPYIRDCIEAVLMQKTTFPVEYIIGEDFSTDGTREIVFEYAKKYPDKIRVFTADYNVGAKANGTRCRRASRGKYMAICEGDDYWTDPYKLQKQVDFLEANPDYGMVHSDNSNYYQHTKQLKYSHKEEYYPNPPSGWVFNDLVKKNFISTLTVVIRTPLLNEIIQHIPDYIYKKLVIDYFFWLEVSTKTKIKYLDDVTAVYRISNNTMSRPNSQTGQIKWMKKIYGIQKYFYNKYECSNALKKQIKLTYYRNLLIFSLNNKNITLGRKAITEIKKTSGKLTFKEWIQFFGCYNSIFYIISKVILRIFRLKLFSNSSLQV